MSAIKDIYCNSIVVILTIYFNYIQGQTYSLSGSVSYGIRGEDYRFICQISGGNIPQAVKFNMSSDTVCRILLSRCQQSSSDTRYTCGCINGNNRTLYLNISDVQSADGGDWVCRDIDVNGDSSPFITLLVYYGPDNIRFTPTRSSITVIENESRSVTCSADCNPPPCNVKWYKGSTLISSTELLSLKNIQRQQAGNYTCQAQHKNITNNKLSKILQITVHYKPILDPNKDTKTSISISRGETGVLTIHVLAYPLPVFTWYYQQQDGSERLIIDFRSNQKDDGLLSTLTIQDVTEDDGRKYIVYVNNSLGTRSIVFNMVVSSSHDDVHGSNNNLLGVGIAVGLGIILFIFAIIVVILWIIFKRTGRRLSFQKITGNGQTVFDDASTQQTRLDNITLSETPPIYDRVDTDAVSTTDPSNTDYINSNTTQSSYEVLDKENVDQQPNSYQQLDTPSRATYEVLDKQTTDQQPNTYQQLSPYQNVT